MCVPLSAESRGEVDLHIERVADVSREKDQHQKARHRPYLLRSTSQDLLCLPSYVCVCVCVCMYIYMRMYISIRYYGQEDAVCFTE